MFTCAFELEMINGDHYYFKNITSITVYTDMHCRVLSKLLVRYFTLMTKIYTGTLAGRILFTNFDHRYLAIRIHVYEYITCEENKHN